MATANTIAAFEAGCECASVTVNGLGERAGNAPLAEVVMALKVALKCDCGFRSRRSCPRLSDFVAQISGRPLPAEKPVVGSAAFRHESGIHCGGLLKDRAHLRAVQAGGHRPRAVANGHRPAFRHARFAAQARRLETFRARRAARRFAGGNPPDGSSTKKSHNRRRIKKTRHQIPKTTWPS